MKNEAGRPYIIKLKDCEDERLFHFHEKTTERIQIKNYNNIAYIRMTHRLRSI